MAHAGAFVNTNMPAQTVDLLLEENPLHPPPWDAWHFMVYLLTTKGVVTYTELMDMPCVDAIRLIKYVLDRIDDERRAEEKAIKDNG